MDEKELNVPETIVPKEVIKSSTKKSTLMPYLLIILGIVILGALAYGYWQYKSDSGLNLIGHKYGGKSVTTTITATTTGSTAATTGAVATATADWKSYESTTYGYSVKYPADWAINLAKEDNILLKSPINTTPENDLMIIYHDKVTDASFNDSKATSLADMMKDTSTFRNTKAVKVGNTDGYETFVGGVGAYYIIYLEKGNHIYELYFSNIENKDSITTTDSNIIDSFTFTDPTVGWKTYTNTTYGYSVKYPADYSAKDLSTQMLNINESSSSDSSLVVAISEDSAITGVNISQSLDNIVSQMGYKKSATTDLAITTLDSIVADESASQGIDTDNYSIIVKNNSHLYRISFENLPQTTGPNYTLSDAKSQLSSVEKTMLSTFQFTD